LSSFKKALKTHYFIEVYEKWHLVKW
jgi:hypothetical protein